MTFFIYGTAAALVFDKLFFPSDNEFVSQMSSYGSFAIGFFARPLGGVVFGHFGDRIGRKVMLVTIADDDGSSHISDWCAADLREQSARQRRYAWSCCDSSRGLA